MRIGRARGAALLGLALLALAAGAGDARAQGRDPTPEACTALRDLYIGGTDFFSTAIVPEAGGLPAFCRVLGQVRPAVHFELRLPSAGWNGKLYMAGCGGFCGNLDADLPGFANAMNAGLRRGYAAATTDGGHWGESRAAGLWGLDNRQAEIDWGYRAVSEVARVARGVATAYYAEAPRHAYFDGCGTGGRMGMVAAQRDPEAFDGIISGDPFLQQTDVMGVLYAWQAQSIVTPDGHALLDGDAVGILAQAALDACDAADGLADGILSDPAACVVEPIRRQCKAGETRCLTHEQVEAARRLYAGATDSDGNRLTRGLWPGSEPYWPLWITGDAEHIGANILFNREFLRYLAYDPDPGESYDPLIFDFDQDPPALAGARRMYDAIDPNLKPFRDRGGRLLLYHGAADAAVPAQYSIDYYELAAQRLGGLRRTQDFFRLFVVPGMDHCALQAGTGPDQFDPLSALEAWVERGEAPDRILASQPARDGIPARTRPLCPFPARALLKAGADPATADSFTCSAP